MVPNPANPYHYYVVKKSPTFSWSPALVSIGAAIRTARIEKGLSQEALAELADMDRSYMGEIERGEHNLAIINLLRIADALEINA